jgi:hypothetical protein
MEWKYVLESHLYFESTNGVSENENAGGEHERRVAPWPLFYPGLLPPRFDWTAWGVTTGETSHARDERHLALRMRL